MNHQQQEKPKQTSKTPTRSSEPALSVRDEAPMVFQLQHALGNQGVLRLLRSRAQAKLTVSSPEDVYEQEADRVADDVMRMPSSVIQTRPGCPLAKGPSCGNEETIQANLIPSTITPLVQREVEEEEYLAQAKPLAAQITPLVQKRVEEEVELLPTKERSGNPPEVSAEVEDQINSLRGGGQPLPEHTRAFMEPRLGYDFGQVRIHTDTKAAETARAINAQAYTVGRDIAFGAGQYAPETPAGKRLLAHELTHVVQQGEIPRSPILRNSEVVRNTIQRVPPAAAAMGAAEWIGLGAAGYAVAQNAVSSTAGDISYTFDEMEGVLLPGGGNDVAAYRARHPNARIQSNTRTVAVWIGTTGSRKMGIKFGIDFNHDGHAIGNISCHILDTYDWPGWGGAVNVNLTPVSLAQGNVAAVRVTINVNADRTLLGGLVKSAILSLDGSGALFDVTRRERPHLEIN